MLPPSFKSYLLESGDQEPRAFADSLEDQIKLIESTFSEAKPSAEDVIEISTDSESEDRSDEEEGEARVKRSTEDYVEKDVEKYKKFREELAELELRCDDSFLRLERASRLRCDVVDDSIMLL